MSQFHGMDLNLDQAIIKGKMDQKVDTARSMLDSGASIQSVCSATGLNSDAVSKLSNQSNGNAYSSSVNPSVVESSNQHSSANVFDSGSSATTSLS